MKPIDQNAAHLQLFVNIFTWQATRFTSDDEVLRCWSYFRTHPPWFRATTEAGTNASRFLSTVTNTPFVAKTNHRKHISRKIFLNGFSNPGYRVAQSVQWLDYGLDDQDSILGGGKGGISFLFATASRSALGPTQPPIQWVPGAISLGVKRPGCKTNHSPKSNAEVTNVWSYTSIPHIRLHGTVLCLGQGELYLLL
jgi:hypothetical protein